QLFEPAVPGLMPVASLAFHLVAVSFECPRGLLRSCRDGSRSARCQLPRCTAGGARACRLAAPVAAAARAGRGRVLRDGAARRCALRPGCAGTWCAGRRPWRGLDRLFKEKFDLLLGRKTYEIFAAYWPYYDEKPHSSIAKLFKDIKKYAVSRSGDVDTSWQGSVLLRDIADVKRLKQEAGPNLVTQGSSELVHALLANDLVDAMSIFTVPVVLGGGKKLFADGSAPNSFKLTRSRVSPNGLIVG